jgi:hypothetical protein
MQFQIMLQKAFGLLNDILDETTLFASEYTGEHYRIHKLSPFFGRDKLSQRRRRKHCSIKRMEVAESFKHESPFRLIPQKTTVQGTMEAKGRNEKRTTPTTFLSPT